MELKYFTFILWNPCLLFKEEILKKIPNIIETSEIKINKTDLYSFVFDIYKMDKRCARRKVLPPKIESLKKHGDRHLFVKCKIENPKFDKNNVCKQAIDIKKEIRKEYKPKIKDYVFDIIIHAFDDPEQSKYVWEKYAYPMTKIKNIFKELQTYVVLRGYDDLHYKIPNLKKGEDIDLLIKNKNDIKDICGSNIIKINNKPIKFDRRFIGDGYYDSNWERNMLLTRIPNYFFYVLNEENNYYATLYHSLIHKGVVAKKYKNLYRLLEEKMEIKIENEDPLQRYYHLLKFMIKNKYQFVRASDKGVGFFKDKYNLNLFLIRKWGMNEKVVGNILSEIKGAGYKVLDIFLTTINNKEKFYKNFYNNFNDFEEEILKVNDNQCLTIVTDCPPDHKAKKLKNKIRKQYASFYPNKGAVPGNLIHSSDSPMDCENELSLLLNKDIVNFKNIGTYYNQKTV
ncbi:hypothetical protein CMI47_04860 [Candidatus Pacearchaeota archaeon]|nr:hypothetical protein [Candidatus Pacearchaeota archaeon]|tara:strand:+ start:3260 stop:4624 length:1365 start_codon:yes stop_codon:yes gene_type:complete